MFFIQTSTTAKSNAMRTTIRIVMHHPDFVSVGTNIFSENIVKLRRCAVPSVWRMNFFILRIAPLSFASDCSTPCSRSPSILKLRVCQGTRTEERSRRGLLVMLYDFLTHESSLRLYGIECSGNCRNGLILLPNHHLRTSYEHLSQFILGVSLFTCCS